MTTQLLLSLAWLGSLGAADAPRPTTYPVFGILQVDPNLRERTLDLQGPEAFAPLRQYQLIYTSDGPALRMVRDAKIRYHMDVPVIVYMGGFTTNEGGATVLEEKYRGGIAMIDVSTLVRPLDAAAREVFVEPPNDGDFPFVAGTAAVTDPEDKSRYAFWIRVDQELMRVTAVDAKAGRLAVQRALESKAAPHAAGARVLVPVYLGNRNDLAAVRHTNSWPGGPDYLRYAIDPATEAGQRFKADLIAEDMRSGYDGAWLDTFQVRTYNLCDPLGRRVTFFWDFRNGRRYDEKSFITAVQEMIRGMRRMARESTGREPVLAANSVSGTYTQGGKLLFQAADRPGLLDRYCFEDSYVRPVQARRVQGKKLQASFEPVLTRRWLEIATNQQDAARNRLGALAMMGPAGYVAAYINPSLPNYQQLLRFSWCSFLLTVTRDRTTAFGLPLLITRIDRGLGFLPLGEMFFYPLGDPMDQGDIATLQVQGTGCYLRRFQGGLVVVNPSEKAQTVQLPPGYRDPTSGKAASRITLEAGDGAVALKRE